MGLADLGKTGVLEPTSGGLSSLGKVVRPASSKLDLNTVEGLTQRAQDVGLGKEAVNITDVTPKLSFLQRLGKGLGAFNPAEAVATGTEKGVGAGVLEYGKDIATGLGSAITGTDYEPNRRSFSDIVDKMGIHNGIAKFGIGLAADVLLDPTTYFGGAIAKGVLKGLKVPTELGLQGLGKLAPEAEAGLRMTGTGLQDAFGRAFVAGFKATKGAYEDVLTHINVKAAKLIQAGSDQLANLGVEGMSKSQRFEVGLKSALGRQGEYLLGEKISQNSTKGRSTATKLIDEAKATGDYSKISAIDENLAKQVNVKFDNPIQQKYFEAQQARAREFAKLGNIEDPYSTYYPFLKKDVREKFLNDISKRGIQVGTEGWHKEFKNVLKIENIELDYAKASFTREAQIISDTESRKFLQEFAGKYGKPLDTFKTEEEARAAGFRLLREKGGFGKAVGYVGEWDKKLFDDLIRPEFQTISILAKNTGFDAITNLFKRAVTGLFLPFHVRNYVSGIIQNFETIGLDALNPRTIAYGKKLAYAVAKGTEFGDVTIGKVALNGKEVLKRFVDKFAGDTFYQNDFLHAVETGSSLSASEKVFSKSAGRSTLGFQKGNYIPLVGQEGVPFRAAKAIGQFIEHQQKATVYLGALGQGKTIDEALKLAERAGFDYRALTAFESQILRRIVPFYSFTRKNVELQLRTLGEHPERINQIMAVFKNVGDQPSADEKQNLPDYIKNSLGIKLSDTPEGLKQYISSFGTPVEAFAQLINGNPVLLALSMTNPILKAPIEIGIGKDSFRQKDLKDVYDAREYKNAPQIIKDLLDIKQGKKDVLNKNAKGKLEKVGERDVYVADPKRLLIARSLFTSRGVTYLDQVFGNDMQGFVKWIKLTTGIKPQQVDTELGATLKERDQQRALEDLLQKTGNISQFSRNFIPKN